MKAIQPYKRLQEKLLEFRRGIEETLQISLRSARPTTSQLYRAMRYTLFGGGKRLRPLLTLLCCDALGGKWKDALPVACAIELIHTYSLIHDDLPCMDNDDYRRGKLASHRKFGEAMAILASDALLVDAFRVIGQGDLEDPQIRQLIVEAAVAAGARGMIGGQALDLQKGAKVSLSSLLHLYRYKTAALFMLSAKAGGIVAKADRSTLEAIERYGMNLGLAFQFADDLKDNQVCPAEILPQMRRYIKMAKRAIGPLRKKDNLLEAFVDHILAM
jgi:geranylgeranyl diphosphate synthase type II